MISLLYLNSRLGFSSLKYFHSLAAISAKLDVLSANTKNMATDLFVDGQSTILWKVSR